jgi:NADH-quinone oxidoreductase subunit M
MIALLLILIPLLAGLVCFALPKNNSSTYSVLGVMVSLSLIILSYYGRTMLTSDNNTSTSLAFSQNWITDLGISFSVNATTLSLLLTLLTGIVFLCIFLITAGKEIKNANTFFGLIMLSMAGLAGVFIAYDAMLFYVFWELALIPVYFLCSMWGGPDAQRVSFKFFIYTFIGSLIMLVALIFMYNKTSTHSFSWEAFSNLKNTLSTTEQQGLFWMLFAAFAIKMPIFPLHTWQPDTYKQSFTPVTIILSAVMVKMGLFAVLRWLIPVLPDAANTASTIVNVLCIIGIVYASLLAMVQTDIKKLIAYSSIAHIGLMCAAIFSFTDLGIKGCMVQMFSHGVNILGMWMLVYYIENKFGTTEMKNLGGIAKANPTFTIFLVLITLANVALPLTNGFVGEFMMFGGIFTSAHKMATLFTVFAGLGIILSAVYSLGMIQKVAFGEANNNTQQAYKFTTGEMLALIIVSALILIFGFFPQPIISWVSNPF